jgi:hypothetical protein
MKTTIRALVIWIVLICLSSCNYKLERLQVDILAEPEITPTSILAGGYVVHYGKKDIISRGICYSLSKYSSSDGSRVTDSSAMSDRLYRCLIDGLIADTTYYLCAFAQDKSGKMAYSGEIEIRTEYTLGCQGPSGGIIFFLDGIGGGLEMAEVDQGSDLSWGCQGLPIDGAQNTGVGDGILNTNAIIATCSDVNAAAKICDDLILNGYDDWHLPSLDELSLIYLNIVKEGKGNIKQGYPYWSSTEQNQDKAWLYHFGTNSKLDAVKNSGAYVRAVRAF